MNLRHAISAAALAATLALGSVAVAAPARTASSELLDRVAEDFVRMTLEAGEREPGYVDAYYGPVHLMDTAKAAPRPVSVLRKEADRLMILVNATKAKDLSPDERRRKLFLKGQIKAAQTRLAMIAGDTFSFEDEAEGLFGVRPVLKPLKSYDPILARIDKLVPGKGDLAARVDAFQNKYVIPTDKVEAVMQAGIAACKAKTEAHIKLPPGERFDLEFVTKKPWSGYNWYKGDAHSLIQINTDLPIYISRALDLGCHEGYPGHHVLNSLLEEKLTKGKGWVEFSVYPLFSPQSFIAEGSANFGIDLAFPSQAKTEFERDKLYPLAGLDPATAKAYGELQEAKAALSSAGNTIAALYLSHKMTKEQAVQALMKYTLYSRGGAEKRVSFIETYRSYVINYNIGQDMVRNHVYRAGKTEAARWAAMEHVISEPTTPADLRK
jgi:HEPN domain-containing protein